MPVLEGAKLVSVSFGGHTFPVAFVPGAVELAARPARLSPELEALLVAFEREVQAVCVWKSSEGFTMTDGNKRITDAVAPLPPPPGELKSRPYWCKVGEMVRPREGRGVEYFAGVIVGFEERYERGGYVLLLNVQQEVKSESGNIGYKTLNLVDANDFEPCYEKYVPKAVQVAEGENASVSVTNMRTEPKPPEWIPQHGDVVEKLYTHKLEYLVPRLYALRKNRDGTFMAFMLPKMYRAEASFTEAEVKASSKFHSKFKDYAAPLELPSSLPTRLGQKAPPLTWPAVKLELPPEAPEFTCAVCEHFFTQHKSDAKHGPLPPGDRHRGGKLIYELNCPECGKQSHAQVGTM